MNIHPHSSSGGDGRRPPGNKNRLGVHGKGASRKSKKRQQRPHQPSQQSGTSDQAHPVFTAADLASEGESFDVMQDPMVFLNLSVAAGNSAGDTGAQTEAAAAQVVAARTATAQAGAAQAAAVQAAVAQPPAHATSSASAPGSSSQHASSAGTSSPRGTFHCPYCSEIRPSLNGIRHHVRKYHDREGALHCFRCRFTAPDSGTIQAHSRSHHDRRHLCPACWRKFTLVELSEHKRNCTR